MTDIYIRRERPSRRPLFIAVALIVIIALGLVIYNVRSRRGAPDEAQPDLPPPPPRVEQPGEPAPLPRAEESPDTTPLEEPEPERVEPQARPEPAASTPVVANTTGQGLLQQATRLKNEGRFLEARAAVLRALSGNLAPDVRKQAQVLGSEINTALAFTPRQMPEKTEYTVQPGDSLAKIAKKFNTTVELLRKSNNITGSLIRVGDRLRVLEGTFSVKVNKTDNYLIVYLNDQFFKRYEVGTGEFGKTPVGTFAITEKIPQPTWWRPDGKAIPYGDDENLLGTHWLSLDVPGYGLHGTWEPETIGHQSSAGCVRLLNPHIEELYALLPVGTQVTITE